LLHSGQKERRGGLRNLLDRGIIGISRAAILAPPVVAVVVNLIERHRAARARVNVWPRAGKFQDQVDGGELLRRLVGGGQVSVEQLFQLRRETGHDGRSLVCRRVVVQQRGAHPGGQRQLAPQVSGQRRVGRRRFQ